MQTVFFILMIMLACVAEAATNAPAVTAVRIVEHGIYKIHPSASAVTRDDTVSGAVIPIDRAALVSVTNRVPATLGTCFGCRFVIEGEPVNEHVIVTIMVRHPVFSKKSAKPHVSVDRVPWTYAVGKEVGYVYRLDEAWECESGEWGIQIWWNGKMYAEQNFVLYDVNVGDGWR